MQVVQLISTAMNLALPTTCVFDYPSAAALAAFIAASQVALIIAIVWLIHSFLASFHGLNIEAKSGSFKNSIAVVRRLRTC